MSHIIPSTALCRVCGDHRLATPFDLSKGYWHCMLRVNHSALREAAISCVLCKAVVSALEAYGGCDFEFDPELRVSSRPGKAMKVNWQQRLPGMKESFLERQLYTPEGQSALSPVFGTQRSISPRPLSEDGISVVKSFLAECETHHTSCKEVWFLRDLKSSPSSYQEEWSLHDPETQRGEGRVASSPYFPRRLIDVGLGDGITHVSLSEWEGPTPKYTALSYCWGAPQDVLTTSHTLQEHKTRIDILTLPSTLRQAIYITRKLHIQYIWIDALAIVQDDRYDWGVESAKMASIYRNAVLTISADISSDSRHGFDSPHELAARAEVNMRSSDNEECVVAIRDSKALCQWNVSLDDSDITNPNVRAYPISRRGWTLQERILSRRIVHYNGQEISWECNEIYRCECAGPERRATESLVSLQLLKPLIEEWGLQKFNDTWEKIIGSYTIRHLTCGTDKLPALSGIARQLQDILRLQELDDTYLAGLWKFNLAQSLAWHKDYGRTPDLVKYHSYRAPSWSWASVDGKVTFAYGVRSKIQILDTQIHLASTDEAGEVVRGSITVSGLSVPIELRRRPAGSFPGKNDSGEAIEMKDIERWVIRNRILVNGERMREYKNREAELNEDERAFLSNIRDGSGYGNDFWYDVHAHEPSDWADKGYRCLLIGETTRSFVRTIDGPKYNTTVSIWMILKPSQTHDGAYERLGLLASNEVFRCYLRENAEERVVNLV